MPARQVLCFWKESFARRDAGSWQAIAAGIAANAANYLTTNYSPNGIQPPPQQPRPRLRAWLGWLVTRPTRNRAVNILRSSGPWGADGLMDEVQQVHLAFSDRLPRKPPPLPPAPHSDPGEPYIPVRVAAVATKYPGAGCHANNGGSQVSQRAVGPRRSDPVTFLPVLIAGEQGMGLFGPRMEPGLSHGGRLSPISWAPVHLDWTVRCLHYRSGPPGGTSPSLLETRIAVPL